MSFWGELKRRNVFRVGIAYLLASWLILQVVDVVAPILELPNWVARAILLLLAVGFVISFFLSWACELTPDGVKREKDVDRSQSITAQTRACGSCHGTLSSTIFAATRDSPASKIACTSTRI